MRTYCLCLPERPERIERAKEHFAAIGLNDVRFFYGIDNDVAGLYTKHIYGLDTDKDYVMGSKPIGIWLSHVMLLSHIQHAYDAHDYIMIVEDDALFPEDWADEMQSALDTLQGFDFLFAGHCCLDQTPMAHIGGKVWRVERPQCTHCYLVRCGVLKEVLLTLRKVYAPFDIDLMLNALPKLNVYAIIPRLVEQVGTEIPP